MVAGWRLSAHWMYVFIYRTYVQEQDVPQPSKDFTLGIKSSRGPVFLIRTIISKDMTGKR